MCDGNNWTIKREYNIDEIICLEFRERWENIRRENKEKNIRFRKSREKNGEFNKCKTSIYGWIFEIRERIRKIIWYIFREV